MITDPLAFEFPEEIPSNRLEDRFHPCWITRTVMSDRAESENEDGWISLVVFEDEKEMLEMIGDWGKPARLRRASKAK